MLLGRNTIRSSTGCYNIEERNGRQGDHILLGLVRDEITLGTTHVSIYKGEQRREGVRVSPRPRRLGCL